MKTKIVVAQLNITQTTDGKWQLTIASEKSTEEVLFFDDVVQLNTSIGNFLLDYQWAGRGLPHSYWEELEKRNKLKESKEKGSQ